MVNSVLLMQVWKSGDAENIYQSLLDYTEEVPSKSSITRWPIGGFRQKPCIQGVMSVAHLLCVPSTSGAMRDIASICGGFNCCLYLYPAFPGIASSKVACSNITMQRNQQNCSTITFKISEHVGGKGSIKVHLKSSILTNRQSWAIRWYHVGYQREGISKVGVGAIIEKALPLISPQTSLS